VLPTKQDKGDRGTQISSVDRNGEKNTLEETRLIWGSSSPLD